MGIRSIAHKPENVLTILTLALFFLVSTPRSVHFFLGLEGEPAKSKTRIWIQFHETIKSKTTLTFTEFKKDDIACEYRLFQLTKFLKSCTQANFPWDDCLGRALKFRNVKKKVSSCAHVLGKTPHSEIYGLVVYWRQRNVPNCVLSLLLFVFDVPIFVVVGKTLYPLAVRTQFSSQLRL